MNEFKKELYTRHGETWREALKRFDRLCHQTIIPDDDDDFSVNLSEIYDDKTLFEIYPPMPAHELDAYAKTYGVNMPEPLRDLLVNHGSFGIYVASAERGIRWGERPFLDFYRSNPSEWPNIKPLMQAISFNFGNYFQDEELSSEEIATLNAKYLCFGYLMQDDGVFDYFVFDQTGRFGTLHYDTHFYQEIKQALKALRSAPLPHESFDAFMTQQIDRAIQWVMEYNDVFAEDEN
jgi:hypothetical protein